MISSTADYDPSITNSTTSTMGSSNGASDYYLVSCTTILSTYERVWEYPYIEETTNYIERILKLAKWYIIYIFNCFRIRAPCIN